MQPVLPTWHQRYELRIYGQTVDIATENGQWPERNYESIGQVITAIYCQLQVDQVWVRMVERRYSRLMPHGGGQTSWGMSALDSGSYEILTAMSRD